jgi:hypothetical protein
MVSILSFRKYLAVVCMAAGIWFSASLASDSEWPLADAIVLHAHNRGKQFLTQGSHSEEFERWSVRS